MAFCLYDLLHCQCDIIFKVWSMLHHESLGRIQSKDCYFMVTYTFLVFFVIFHLKKFSLLYLFNFFFFFLMKYQFFSEMYGRNESIYFWLYHLTASKSSDCTIHNSSAQQSSLYNRIWLNFVRIDQGIIRELSFKCWLPTMTGR